MAEATDAVSGRGEHLEWPSKKSKALQKKVRLLTELSNFMTRNIASLPYTLLGGMYDPQNHQKCYLK